MATIERLGTAARLQRHLLRGLELRLQLTSQRCAEVKATVDKLALRRSRGGDGDEPRAKLLREELRHQQVAKSKVSETSPLRSQPSVCVVRWSLQHCARVCSCCCCCWVAGGEGRA